jgi:hypothetical protein
MVFVLFCLLVENNLANPAVQSLDEQVYSDDPVQDNAKNHMLMLAVVAHTFKARTQEAKAGGSL